MQPALLANWIIATYPEGCMPDQDDIRQLIPPQESDQVVWDEEVLFPARARIEDPTWGPISTKCVNIRLAIRRGDEVFLFLCTPSMKNSVVYVRNVHFKLFEQHIKPRLERQLAEEQRNEEERKRQFGD